MAHRSDGVESATLDILAIVESQQYGLLIAANVQPEHLVLERGDFLPREKANWSVLQIHQKP